MKNFTMATNINVQAVQYTQENTYPKKVKQCCMLNNEISGLGDMLGTPRDAFYALETKDGYQRINFGDWIVTKNGVDTVVPDNLFKLLFVEQ